MEDEDDELINEIPKKKIKLMSFKERMPTKVTTAESNEQAEASKNKLSQKQSKSSNSERKKAKKQKLLNKQKLLGKHKMQTVETPLKLEKEVKVKAQVKVEGANVYNKEDKMFFSKFHVEGEKKKKSADTNPQVNIKKLRDQKDKIKQLIEAGEKDKAKGVKEKILWKTAFEKTEGIKVKDNPEILKKTIKNRKVMKKASKEKWKQRKDNVKEKQATQQKKREDNIAKRKTSNQKIKLKKAVKKGRMIKGVSG